MTMYLIYKKNQLVITKQVVNVHDLGYLGVETDFPEQLSLHYHIKRKETNLYLKKKKRKQNSFKKEERYYIINCRSFLIIQGILSLKPQFFNFCSIECFKLYCY